MTFRDFLIGHFCFIAFTTVTWMIGEIVFNIKCYLDKLETERAGLDYERPESAWFI